MVSRLTDSRLYGHLWATDELRALFDEEARLQVWLDILAALARAQATLGIIPIESAREISRGAVVDRLDLDFVAAETRRTSHSTLGLIRGLQRVLPSPAADHVYLGTTVQDVTDTWTVLTMRSVGRIVWRDLRALEEVLLTHAERHRNTVMVGRTHGQPGSPVTFGFKAASWADEVRRHLDRLREGRDRWLVGQLGGAVGTLGFFGERGLDLRAAFCAELGLGVPAISWLTARDRVAEFGLALAMVCSTLARIGGEVYELARPEIGELREATTADAVGSITMPHKRNPERSEHLDTLARVVRANAAVLLEGMVGAHERDGRSWKAEWACFPEVCLLTGTALELAIGLVSGLEVDTTAMAAKLNDERYRVGSERVLAFLTDRLGRHEAQAVFHEAVRPGDERPPGLRHAAAATGLISDEELADLLDAPALGSAAAMVDGVMARARQARRDEPEEWA